MPNIKRIDPRQFPCQFGVEDHGARQEMVQVQNLCRDNTKRTMPYYTDYRSGMLILYYKDIRNLMDVQILAKKSGWKGSKAGGVWGGDIQNVHRHYS